MNKKVLSILIIVVAIVISAVVGFGLNNTELIFDEIFRALGYLLIAGVVWFAWKTANDSASESSPEVVLWKGFLWCAGIALFASITLGSPTCEYVSDPVYGGCEQYADNGYEPTTDQRAAKFAYFMTLLYLPVVVGAFSRRRNL